MWKVECSCGKVSIHSPNTKHQGVSTGRQNPVPGVLSIVEKYKETTRKHPILPELGNERNKIPTESKILKTTTKIEHRYAKFSYTLKES